MKKMVVLLLSIFITNCSGTNQYLNNKNTLGLLGAGAGAYGGSQLCKNCSGGAKIAAIAGASILSMFAMSKVGEFIDQKDIARQKRLIQDVMESNPDNMTSTDTYKKTWTNPNGQQQTGMVTQSVTPLRTYKQQHQAQQSGLVVVPRNRNCGTLGTKTCGEYTGNINDYIYTPPHMYEGHPNYPYGRNRNRNRNRTYASSGGYCRDAEITISIEGLGQPTQQQFYTACRTEQGWRSIY